MDRWWCCWPGIMNTLRSIPTRCLQILNMIFEYYYFGNVKFWQQKFQGIVRTPRALYCYWGSNPQPLCYKVVRATTLPLVCCSVNCTGEISLYIEATDYRSNLAKTILFENCSCFFFLKIPFSISVESPRIFQGLISIPAGHWVRQIDGKSSAICLADSFCQHYSALWSAWQEDPNDPQERCAMARTSCARL